MSLIAGVLTQDLSDAYPRLFNSEIESNQLIGKPHKEHLRHDEPMGHRTGEVDPSAEDVAREHRLDQ